MKVSSSMEVVEQIIGALEDPSPECVEKIREAADRLVRVVAPVYFPPHFFDLLESWDGADSPNEQHHTTGAH